MSKPNDDSHTHDDYAPWWMPAAAMLSVVIVTILTANHLDNLRSDFDNHTHKCIMIKDVIECTDIIIIEPSE